MYYNDRRIGQEFPASYPYWDLDLLRREALINTRMSDLVSARLRDLGVEDHDGITVRRFALHNRSARA